MITVRPGSHMYHLLRLLSVSGEFPSKSLGILGDVRTIKTMIHKMETAQKIRLYSNGTVIKTKLFQVSGLRNKRTIRLAKNALPVLNEFHPDALGYYMNSYPDNKFTGNLLNMWRNHRVGEAMAVCMMAGIETAPYILPELQKDSIRRVIPETPSYYISRDFKKIYEAELSKTIFTRMIGLLFYPGDCYSVYNTRDSVMRWSGLGEIKARQEVSEIVRMNAKLHEVTSALLFGNSEEIALQTIINSDKSLKKELRFDRVYNKIHFVPLNKNGVDLVKILTLPDWHEKLMSVLFSSKTRMRGYDSIEYDAYQDDKYYYSYFDGDIARLIRFKGSLQSRMQSFEILCFPWQAKFLNDYLSGSVTIKQLATQTVLKALKIK